MKRERTFGFTFWWGWIAWIGLALAGCTFVPPQGESDLAVAVQVSPSPLRSTTELIPSTLPTLTLTHEPIPTSTPVPNPSSTPTGVPTPKPLSLVERQQLFDEVWHTIDEHYLYPDFRGVDWQAVRDEFAPQVETTLSNASFYALLDAMVQRLNDQHSRFLAPSDADQEDAFSSGHTAQVGIGVLTMPASDGELIQMVFPDSPAALAGLRPRDRIIEIDGLPYNAGKDIEGPEGTQVQLTVWRPGATLHQVTLTRRAVEGRIGPTLRRLEGDIAYLSITTLWVNDMAEQVSTGLTAMVAERPLRGLILDLRGNPGGWRSVLTELLSHFVRDNVGAFFSKQGDMPLIIGAGRGPDLRNLPLAVLIDSGTASYAELLAGILQAEVGACVVGEPSAGNTETIYAYELSGGARLWVAQEGFRLRNGVNLEGRGVQPNVLVNQDWTRYSEEEDPGIRTALRLLIQLAGSPAGTGACGAGEQ